MLDRGYLGDPSPRSVYKALTGSQDTEQNRKIFPFAYFHANFNYRKTAQKDVIGAMFIHCSSKQRIKLYS